MYSYINTLVSIQAGFKVTQIDKQIPKGGNNDLFKRH